MPREHLIKRNKDFTQSGALTTAKGVQYFTESKRNGRPSGFRAKAGERLWVAEVGYGIYASGVLTADPTVIEFTSISDLLDRLGELKVQDDPYIMGLIRKIHEADTLKALHVLVVEADITDLGRVIQPPQRARGQGSWYYLEPGEVDLESTGNSLELSRDIPGAVRLRVYQRLARQSDRHIIDVDHFVPRSVGGPGNLEENLVPVSLYVNRAKRDRIPTGLFHVAAAHPDLKDLVPTSHRDLPLKLLFGHEPKDIARKVVARVNAWRDLDLIRGFYRDVVERHLGPQPE